MDIINPIQINSGAIVSYNVPQDTPIWDEGTSYDKNDIVTKDDCGAIRYRSLENNNIGNDPATSPLEWPKLDTPSNCYAMFDSEVGTQTFGDLTIDDGDIKISIAVGSNLSGIGFLNIADVGEIYIKITDTSYGVVYEKTVEMSEKAIDGWYDWYFGGFTVNTTYVDFNFNMPMGGTLDVEFRAVSGAVAKVGSFIYGSLFNIGTTTYGLGLELKDFSRVEEDEFGNLIVIPRATSNRPTYPVIIENARVDEVYRTLRSLKGKAILWIPDTTKFEEARVLGFYRNLRIDFPTPAYAECSLQITGVTN